MNNIYIYKIKRHLGKIPFAAPLYHFLKSIFLYYSFLVDFIKFKELVKKDNRLSVNWKDQFPCLLDKTLTTGFEPHYTYHPPWAARIIAKNKPKLHIDFSSFLSFSTMLSAFIPVEFYDYRPADVKLDNLITKRGNLLKLPFQDGTIESISSMHVVEHIGLGRYGDTLDPNGDLKAIAELKRVLAPGGSLLFVVPLGKPRIEFNAHRIYSYDQIVDYFSDLKLEEFSLIPDNSHEVGMLRNPPKNLVALQEWGCGCFWFKK